MTIGLHVYCLGSITNVGLPKENSIHFTCPCLRLFAGIMKTYLKGMSPPEKISGGEPPNPLIGLNKDLNNALYDIYLIVCQDIFIYVFVVRPISYISYISSHP